ncbi:SulP family inorganic anion transporter [Streptomyces sp. NPDC059455]|uniref:SulP family inorganic anion transporter n=1 Tax=Streptomyces sp. NPDC059455 TaxID=3346837 RepID=UPI0036C741EA
MTSGRHARGRIQPVPSPSYDIDEVFPPEGARDARSTQPMPAYAPAAGTVRETAEAPGFHKADGGAGDTSEGKGKGRGKGRGKGKGKSKGEVKGKVGGKTGGTVQGVDLGTEITASLVVFLVALPLCIGVAVASGTPAELGIITGVVGGLVVGMTRGSALQVSGPAAGLTALVAETVEAHGIAMLGVIVLMSGLLQIGLGMIRLGRMFQAISIAVVQGMLAGIGLPLMFSQSYPLADATAPGTAIENILGFPAHVLGTFTNAQTAIAALLGIATVVLSFVWKKVPGPVSRIPAALVAVAIGVVIAALPGVEVKTLQVGDLLSAVQVPGPEQFAGLADPAVLTAVITFTVIASAESLFTAAAVDRMHDGPRTRYNTELIAQGAGNTVCGVLGALPMTAVVARSSANVQAGAKTRLSRTLHGLWLLAFALLLPSVLALIPVAVLAGVLVHSGWKLLAPEQFPKMWRQDRGEFVVMAVTTGTIVATALLEGVLVGLAAGIVLAALRMSRTSIEHRVEGDTAKLVMTGNATFLRLPKVIDALEAVGSAGTPRIRLDLMGVTHLDHACRSQIEEFVEQKRASGAVRVELLLPDLPRPGSGPGSGPRPKPRRKPRPESSPESPPAAASSPVSSPASPSWPPPQPHERSSSGALYDAFYGPSQPGPSAEWYYLDTRPFEGLQDSEDARWRDHHG